MSAPRAIVIGCSAGGMRALKEVLSKLRTDLGAPILAVCHTGSEDVTTLCELVGAASALPVREARERQVAHLGVLGKAGDGLHPRPI